MATDDDQGYGNELHMDGDGYDVEDELDAGLQGLAEMEDLGEGSSKQGDLEAQHELESMRSKLREMEEEAAKLREMQSKVTGEAGVSTGEVPTPGSREEADARSVYVGNVDYACTPEELQMHFQGCGTVNRVTILADRFGQPKGFAYVEFLEADAVQQAVLLNDTELQGRQIKVNPKRTNVPGMKQRARGRGRGGFGYAGYYPYGYMPFYPPPFPPFGRGFAPRGRGARARGRGRAPY